MGLIHWLRHMLNNNQQQTKENKMNPSLMNTEGNTTPSTNVTVKPLNENKPVAETAAPDSSEYSALAERVASLEDRIFALETAKKKGSYKKPKKKKASKKKAGKGKAKNKKDKK